METGVRRVKVRAVPVRQQNGAWKRDVKHDDRPQTLDGGLHARWEIAVTDLEHHWHALHVVHVVNGNLLELFEGPGVELKAWSDLRAIQVAVFRVAFGTEDQAYIGTETKVRIHFGEEVGHGCLGPHGS